jgi:hypothetical protein
MKTLGPNMTVKTPIAIALVLIATAYAASPCVTLVRLNAAVRNGDTTALSRFVDWGAVRDGLAEDVADEVTATPSKAAVASSGELPAFGHGFMRGIAAHAIQTNLTPQRLIERFRGDTVADALSLQYAYFDRWSRFIVKLAGTENSATISLQLDLEQDGVWRVTRVQVPSVMLRHTDPPAPPKVITAEYPTR